MEHAESTFTYRTNVHIFSIIPSRHVLHDKPWTQRSVFIKLLAISKYDIYFKICVMQSLGLRWSYTVHAQIWMYEHPTMH
jgi:hypothetical protein